MHDQPVSSQSGPPHLLFKVLDGVGHICLNRPEVRNALSDQMKHELDLSLTQIETDEAIRAILITAAGDHFMVGADLRQFHHELTTDREHHVATFEARVLATSALLSRLRVLDRPVVLAAQGQTVGIGFCMAALADLVIASDDAEFMLAYCHIGLSPDAGITWALPRIVGERRAKQIAYLGERIGAATALEWGFANQIVERKELEEQAWKLARRLARSATLSLAGSKTLIGGAFDRGWEDQVRLEANVISRTAASQDHKEGLCAFLEKRKPDFQGR